MRRGIGRILLGVALAGPVMPAMAQATHGVTVREVIDRKAVFATVESPNVVPARARIGGTVVALAVRDGDAVTQGQVIATIGDDKIALQIGALDALIVGLQAQMAQAQTDLARAETLLRQGSGTRVTADQARTALDVASAQLKARMADRAVLRQSLTEGAVLAPVGGRVLSIPVTQGTVVMPGDPVGQIAEGRYQLRLRVPERLAGTLKVGDPVRLEGVAAAGRITLVYPQISEGRVVADATMEGIGDYFVGARVLAWINAGTRRAIMVPERFLVARAGLDYARVRVGGRVAEVPVQRGVAEAGLVEVLSGLAEGDELVAP